jgi:hypothetical protein
MTIREAGGSRGGMRWAERGELLGNEEVVAARKFP